MSDTRPEAAQVQLAAFRRLTPEARVALAFEASEWIMAVSRARPLAGPAGLTVDHASTRESSPPPGTPAAC
jgi:hypothetical protein